MSSTLVNLGRFICRHRTKIGPGIPTSGMAYTNTFGVTCRGFISGGTVSAIVINWITTGITSGMVELAALDTITRTYSSAPS